MVSINLKKETLFRWEQQQGYQTDRLLSVSLRTNLICTFDCEISSSKMIELLVIILALVEEEQGEYKEIIIRYA